MRLRLAALFASVFLFSAPAFAVMEDYPSVKLQGLDKSVGRTVTFEAKVGSTIQYGPLYIKIHACRKAPPIEQPESAAFLQIWEVPPGAQKSEWVFSGWMFASSPALSAMDHPVYDVWVLDCTGREEPNEAAAAAESEKEADQTNLPAPDGETTDPSIPEGAAPSIQETTPPAKEAVPVDGEAEMGDDPAAPVAGATADPDAPYVPPAEPAPQAQPAEPTETINNPNEPQQDSIDTPVIPDSNRAYDPATEGVYSPSQGRIVYPDAPAPTNQYPDYDPSKVPQVAPQY